MRTDRVDGFRNNTKMKDMPLTQLLEALRIKPTDRRDRQMCLAYSVSGKKVAKAGYPPLVAVPGKYDYK